VLQFQVAAYQEYALEHYLTVIHGKTAALTQLAAEAPAVLLGAPQAHREALATFGREYGMAFQMQDDLLDLAADEATLGKPVGGDLREGKATFPLLHLLQGPHGDEVRDVLERRASHEGDVARVQALAAQEGAFEATRAEVRRRAWLAVDALRALPAGDARDALERLAVREIERSR
jgi:octaprenyl-diphosphate synthase